MHYLVAERSDGSITVRVPNMRHWDPAVETEEDYCRRMCQINIQKFAGLPMMEVDADVLPSSEFRGAWTMAGARVIVDPTKETAIRWDRIRLERDRHLAASDGLMARANETGVQIAVWKTYRQALRDLPQTYNDPKLVVWPTPPGA